MYAWFYSHNSLLSLPVAAMFLFMAVFVIACVRAVSMARRTPQATQALASLPLAQEELAPAGSSAHSVGGRHV